MSENIDKILNTIDKTLDPDGQLERDRHSHHFVDHINNLTSGLVQGIETGTITEQQAWLALAHYSLGEAGQPEDV